jgi:uncharacterized protein DUF2784
MIRRVSPALLADVVVVLHLVYVSFVLFGFAAIWLGVALRWGWVRRPAFRIPHLVCTLIVPLEALGGLICPLTTWERELRVEAGQAPEDIAFVARLARDLLFYQAPEWVFTLCYVLFGLLVLWTFFRVPIRRRAQAT